MKDRKIKFRYFTIMEWEKEQDFLRQEGLKGWRFTKATLLGIYHLRNASQKTWFISWTIILTELLTKNNMSRCSGTAAGNISRIISATAISGSRLLKWPGMKKSSVMTNPGWRW